MYVALTRAQTRMLHGRRVYCQPSLFLDELPAAPRAIEAQTPDGLCIGQNDQHAKFGLG